MAQTSYASSEHQSGQGHGSHHTPGYYVKIWAILMVLLFISIAGPMLGHPVLTLVTAFGIAVVKAVMVAGFFMHLDIEKRYIWYMLIGMLLMVGLFFAGTATDVHRLSGSNWINLKRLDYITRSLEEIKLLDEVGEGGHHE